MPESKSRKSAAAKKKVATSRKVTERQQANTERAGRTGGAKASETVRDRARVAAAANRDADSTRGKRAKASSADDDTVAEGKRPLSTAERRRLQRAEDETPRRRGPVSRRWVPPTFITVGLLGVAWLITYYIAGVSGIQIPYMMDWGNWNILIGMGLMGAAFGLATLWK